MVDGNGDDGPAARSERTGGREESTSRERNVHSEYEPLWTIEPEVQFTGLPRSVYFVTVLMEWLRFRTKQFPFPDDKANYKDCPGIKFDGRLMAILLETP